MYYSNTLNLWVLEFSVFLCLCANKRYQNIACDIIKILLVTSVKQHIYSKNIKKNP